MVVLLYVYGYHLFIFYEKELNAYLIIFLRLPNSAEIRLAIIEMHEMVNLTCNQVQQLERVP